MNNLKKVSVSKVTPIQVKPIKDVIYSNTSYADKLKYIVTIQAMLGFNRLYVLKYGKVQLWITYVYSMLLIACVIIYMIYKRSSTTSSYQVIQVTSCVEFLLLVFISITSKKKTLEKFFVNLHKFDEKLNIIKDHDILESKRRIVVWILISLIYSITQYVILLIYMSDEYNYDSIIIYLTNIAHDLEQIFFCTLLRSIYLRVVIIKEHIAKTFDEKKRNEKPNEFEALSNNTKLDISTLHRMYELLHKCAEQLNSTMSSPMIILLFCSGLSTTMLLRILFKTLQMDDSEYVAKDTMITYISVRCIKYTLLVIFPCYYSSITTTQVSNIRTMLHDAVNGVNLDKIERRRVKAFFQLTRENEFAYALWGVIRLNMSLPLSYSSLCATYLVIIIQFSKFID